MIGNNLRKYLIRNRRQVNLIVLLLMYQLAWVAVTWEGMGESPNARNLAVIREALNSTDIPEMLRYTESLEDSQILDHHDRLMELVRNSEDSSATAKTLDSEMNEVHQSLQRAKVLIQRYRKSKVKESKQKLEQLQREVQELEKREAFIKDESRQVLSRLNETTDRIRAHDMETLTLTQTMLNRLADIINTVNTRRPRVITMQEFTEYWTLSQSIRQCLITSRRIDSNRVNGMIDDFLQRSHLAGVEGAIPVVPTDPDLYSVKNMHEVAEVWKAADARPFHTSELHRGEALWVNPNQQDGAEDGAEAEEEEAQRVGERRERARFPCNLCGTLTHRVCCALASYCCKECQDQDWRDHKSNCNRIQMDDRINAQIDANMMQNMARPDLQGLNAASVRRILFEEARQAEIAQAAQAALSNDLPEAGEIPDEELGEEMARDEEMARVMQQQEYAGLQVGVEDGLSELTISLYFEDGESIDHSAVERQLNQESQGLGAAMRSVEGEQAKQQALAADEAAVPHTKPLPNSTICAHCGKETKMKCCGDTFFCDNRCRKQGREKHFLECKHFESERSKINEKTYVLSKRIFEFAKKYGTSDWNDALRQDSLALQREISRFTLLDAQRRYTKEQLASKNHSERTMDYFVRLLETCIENQFFLANIIASIFISPWSDFSDDTKSRIQNLVRISTIANNDSVMEASDETMQRYRRFDNLHTIFKGLVMFSSAKVFKCVESFHNDAAVKVCKEIIQICRMFGMRSDNSILSGLSRTARNDAYLPYRALMNETWTRIDTQPTAADLVLPTVYERQMQVYLDICKQRELSESEVDEMKALVSTLDAPQIHKLLLLVARYTMINRYDTSVVCNVKQITTLLIQHNGSHLKFFQVASRMVNNKVTNVDLASQRTFVICCEQLHRQSQIPSRTPNDHELIAYSSRLIYLFSVNMYDGISYTPCASVFFVNLKLAMNTLFHDNPEALRRSMEIFNEMLQVWPEEVRNTLIAAIGDLLRVLNVAYVQL